MERFFVYMAASAYHEISKEAENCVLRYNCIFRCTSIYTQPMLTKQWNYNNFLQILYSYLRYTDRLLDVLFLLPAVILSELHENQLEKTEWQKKVHIRLCLRDITFLAARSSSYVIFCRFFRLFLSFAYSGFTQKKNFAPENGGWVGEVLTPPLLLQCLRPCLKLYHQANEYFEQRL